MLEEPKPNAWETLGWEWRCTTCPDRSPRNALYDYDVAYPAARYHASKFPSHRVNLHREQARWVIPSALEAGKDGGR